MADPCAISRSPPTDNEWFPAASTPPRSPGPCLRGGRESMEVALGPGERRGLPPGRAHSDERRRRPHRHLAARRRQAGCRPGRPHGSRRQSRGFPRWQDARLCELGQHGAAVVACGRCAPGARRTPANVNGVAFTPDGRAVVTVSYDLTLRIWPLAGGGGPTTVTLPSPLNSVAVAAGRTDRRGGRNRQGVLPVGCRRVPGRGRGAPVPIIALAVSSDGKLVAASSFAERWRSSIREPPARAYARWSWSARLVGGLPSRQHDVADRRRRSPDPPLERGDGRAYGPGSE